MKLPADPVDSFNEQLKTSLFNQAFIIALKPVFIPNFNTFVLLLTVF